MASTPPRPSARSRVRVSAPPLGSSDHLTWGNLDGVVVERSSPAGLADPPSRARPPTRPWRGGCADPGPAGKGGMGGVRLCSAVPGYRSGGSPTWARLLTDLHDD